MVVILQQGSMAGFSSACGINQQEGRSDKKQKGRDLSRPFSSQLNFRCPTYFFFLPFFFAPPFFFAAFFGAFFPRDPPPPFLPALFFALFFLAAFFFAAGFFLAAFFARS